ncbi:hypothetical protein ILUMI_13261, partial [Ignelater luminosus]
CDLYRKGAADGTLCIPVCESKEIFSLSCHAYHTVKETVFGAIWGDTKLVFKLADTAIPALHWYDNGALKYPTEKEFISTIRAVTKNMLNHTLSNDVINKLAHFKPKHKESDLNKRRTEMDNIWILIQDNEYLLSSAYSNRDVFPQVLGTCGPYFAVEYVEPMPEPFSILYDKDTRENWGQNLKYSLLLMELLEELENNFKEPLHLCDVKLRDFGVTDPENGRVKILDLDAIYPKSIINKFLKNIGSCEQDEDCKIFDCRGKCNKERQCDSTVSNNNLQIICEKIFLGWRMSNRMLLPGLLLSQYAPAELMSVLRQCANPENEDRVPRAAAHEDIKKRLYSILVDVEQAVNTDPYL